MVALYQISSNTIIQNYGGNIPNVISVPGIKLNVHNPEADWYFGDFKFIPVSYTGTPISAWSVATGTTQTLQDVNGELTCVITTNYVDPPLAVIKARLMEQVDNEAESVRLKYIAPNIAQMGVYILRFFEAKEILNTQNPNPDNFPLNKAGIGKKGKNNLREAAEECISQGTLWISLASIIEDVRLKAKDDIEAATTIAQAENVVALLDWQGL